MTRQIWLQVGCRFLAHFLLYLPVFLAAWCLVNLIFFPREHPYQSGLEIDREKFPAKFNYYAAIPMWVSIGGLTGMFFSAWGASRTVRAYCLLALAGWVVYLSVWQADSIAGLNRTEHDLWPLWMLALCMFASAAAVCRYWPLAKTRK